MNINSIFNIFSCRHTRHTEETFIISKMVIKLDKDISHQHNFYFINLFHVYQVDLHNIVCPKSSIFTSNEGVTHLNHIVHDLTAETFIPTVFIYFEYKNFIHIYNILINLKYRYVILYIYGQLKYICQIYYVSMIVVLIASYPTTHYDNSPFYKTLK